MITAENSSLHEFADKKSASALNRWLLVGLMVFGFSLGYLLLGPLAPAKQQVASVPADAQAPIPLAEPNELLLPDKSLSPAQVVDAQMKALTAYQNDRRAIHQVFAFASPANRSMTGPIGRFEQMILQPPYNLMVVNDHWMAGRAVTREGLATVLVTTVDTQGRLSLFRFYLSVQSDTFADCWMTDRVVCLFRGEFGSEGGLTTEPPHVDAI